jgi:hypothetical protein
MTSLRSETIQRWWPTTQTLDLVEGTAETVAIAVQAEVSRFLGGEPIVSSWETYRNLDAAFGAATEFANVPTVYVILPTHSKWTVLWNNSFLCDGYDSLCHCLTKNHSLTTIHWSANDEWTSFQSGANFHYRLATASGISERFVQVAQQDSRWHFFESGQPLDVENTTLYSLRRKRDRLNETIMSLLLARLGAAPWSDEFYSLPGRCFVIRRSSPPITVTKRNRGHVLSKC